jgi:hypothetical protein
VDQFSRAAKAWAAAKTGIEIHAACDVEPSSHRADRIRRFGELRLRGEPGKPQFVALDFIFWPSGRVGLWVEPSYDFVFRDGIYRGIGNTGGVLLGW